ncbi:MAG: hypothetical protein N3E51_00150 [Candidatus Micrarchaeota archaeon]|nr:hypothetical protein [Candidatus Micrarchaeota archaeon]
MITGIKIQSAEAKHEKDEEVSGLNINISIESVSSKGGETTIAFKYVASYLEGVGELKMGGLITAKEDAKLTREIVERWEKEKRLPDDFAEIVLNAINYACGTNGVLVARAVNLSPPIVPPRIELSPSATGQAGGGKGKHPDLL